MKKIYIESPESEKKYLKLAKLGGELKIPIPAAFLEMEIRMPNRDLIHRHKQRSHSWNRNTYNELAACLMYISGNGASFAAGEISVKDTGGTHRTGTASICLGQNSNVEVASSNPSIMAAIGVDTSGIVVGSGSDAESFEGHALSTKIAHGTGVGQISYGASEAPVKSYVAGTKTYSVAHARYYNNNSGGNITINEIAIYLRMVTGAAYNSVYVIMTTRDLLAASVVIPDTGQLKVTYTFSLVYPA
jgi:hypothetical protein